LTTLLVVSPDAAGPFITPCQLEAVTEKTLSSLFLTTVRVVTERGDLKDILQEVKETLLLPRKHLFASERHLRPPLRHAKIGYKAHSLPWPMGSLVSGSPCISMYAAFLFSFLQLNSVLIKSFQPLLLESVLSLSEQTQEP
jgi:hypothetical protein